TVARIQRDLTKDSLVYRYRIHDGVPGEEATLAICSFWLVQVLARQGRAKEAIKLFRHICSFASDLGLFAEEIDPDSKALLGNYPQGYT
ncbi:glycoside hydrolase family 15 protein, partial [Salmonella enterica subsp. enterica serovar Typhimurium]|nr:glycoside hydrolase family 15 protein [Salmonella enterica subsp. enterica serovar Typhimurium]